MMAGERFPWVWNEQLEEMQAEIALHWDLGEDEALTRLLGHMRSWLRNSPCPNALVYVIEYGQAALDTIALGPGYDVDAADAREVAPEPKRSDLATALGHERRNFLA